MTAIAGFVNFNGAPLDPVMLSKAKNIIRPYGLDSLMSDEVSGGAFMAAILCTYPEDNYETQPVTHQEAQTTCLFLGRLDNRAEISKALDIPPSKLLQTADSWLALHAYLKWGTECVKHFHGEYSIAWWDAKSRTMRLARDPMGTRPLFWHNTKNGIVFSSVAQCLLPALQGPARPSEKRFFDFLALNSFSGPESFFAEINRVEPGTVVEVNSSSTHISTFYNWGDLSQIKLSSRGEYVEAFRAVVSEAISSKIRGVSGVGSHLSSGFDSTFITALAAKELQDSGQMLTAFTAAPILSAGDFVPSGHHADESGMAEQVAKMYPNINHKVVRTGPSNLVDHMEKAVETLGRPPLNPCNMPWVHALNETANASGVKMVLTGVYGNQTISHSGMSLFPMLFMRLQLSQWFDEFRNARRRHPTLSYRYFLKLTVDPILETYRAERQSASRFRKDLSLNSALNPRFAERMLANGEFWQITKARKELAHYDSRISRIAALTRFDNGETTNAANASGIELRSPARDLRVVSFCLSVPENIFCHHGVSHWLLREAGRPMLPESLFRQRTRGLQAANWHASVRHSKRDLEAMLHRIERSALASEYLDVPFLRAALDNFSETDKASVGFERKYRLKMLRGFSAAAFLLFCPD